jgi:serine/threonine protein kinase
MLPLSIGSTLAGPNSETFKITDFIGKGAFGEVYRAVGNLSGRVVAVKLLPVGILSSYESRMAL